MFRIPVRTELTDYEISSASGQYVRTTAGVEFWGQDHIVFSASLPFLFTSPDEGDREAGLGNLLGNVQVMTSPLSWLSVAGGILVEAPTGDSDLVDQHWVALNHVQLRVDMGAPVLMWRGGYLKAFGGTGGDAGGEDGHDHDHDHHHGTNSDPIVIDPHGSQELRMQAGVGLLIGDWTPALFLDSAIVLDDASAGEQFHSVGTRLQWALSEDITTEVLSLIPVTEQRRYDWRTSLGVTIQR